MYGNDFSPADCPDFYVYPQTSRHSVASVHLSYRPPSPSKVASQLSSNHVLDLPSHNTFTTHPKITEANETEQDKTVQRNNMFIRPIYINPSTNQGSNQPHMNFVKKAAQVNPVFCCLPCAIARCLGFFSKRVKPSLPITHVLHPVLRIVQSPNPNPSPKLHNSQSQPTHQQEDIHLYNKKIGEGVSTKKYKATTHPNAPRHYSADKAPNTQNCRKGYKTTTTTKRHRNKIVHGHIQLIKNVVKRHDIHPSPACSLLKTSQREDNGIVRRYVVQKTICAR